MFLLYTQQVVQADATGIFILALIVSAFVIPPIVKKSKISEAEDIKKNYPQGYNKVCHSIYYIDYQNAKKIIDKRYQIIDAQREYDEEKRRTERERYIRAKANEIRRQCPYATKIRSDEYIASNEYLVRADEKIHNEQEAKAKKILQDNPLGVKELYGYVSSYGSLSDEDIDRIISTESLIRQKQKEGEANEAELKVLSPKFIELRRKYPLGVAGVCAEKKWSTSNAEHVNLLLSMPGTIAEKQEQKEAIILGDEAKLEPIIKKAKELNSKEGMVRAKASITMSHGTRIAAKVMGVVDAEERFLANSKHLDSIAKTQNDFAQETRNLFPKVMESYGWYAYKFKMEYMDEQSNAKSYTLTVWQAFNDSCCLDDTVSYEYYPICKEHRTSKTKLENGCSYQNDCWDKVLSFISEIKKKYGDEVYVVFANTDHLNDKAYKNNHKYIESELTKAGIKYGDSILHEQSDSANKKYIVIDIITENVNLIQYCSSIFHYRHIMQIENNKGTTGVVFISMLKCFDGSEVEELNKKKIKEKEDAIRKAKAEEEQRLKDERDISEAKSLALASPVGFKHYFPDCSTVSIDAYKARQIIQKRSSIKDYENTLSRLRNSVSAWDCVRSVPHYFFYYYYPTRFTDISAESRDARRLIYNFKDGLAHNKVKELVVNKLRNTFNSSDLSRMCFVCIPASTRSVHQSRYEDFSHEVCQELGMADAYDYITITKEKTPAHLGGDDSAEYSYNKFFFNGKFVVLFDDIVTRGGSVSSIKAELEALGAVVICAISIGRTFSDWNGNLPKPHPYTGRI